MAEPTTEFTEGVSPETKREFEEIIKSSGARIIPPEEYNLPQTYNLPELPEEDREFLEDAIEVFETYLGSPIIVDDFKSHAERRQWRIDTFDSIAKKDGLEKAHQFDAFLRANKMKRNNIAALMGLGDFMVEEGIVPPQVAEKLMASAKDALPNKETGADPWEGPTTPEKIDKVKEISQGVLEILNFLGAKH